MPSCVEFRLLANVINSESVSLIDLDLKRSWVIIRSILRCVLLVLVVLVDITQVPN